MLMHNYLTLLKWMMAFWMIVNCKNGISSMEIHRVLGITQKSAWFMLQRLRLALQSGDFGKLQGHVEVDETFIGGKARFMHKSARNRRTLTSCFRMKGWLENTLTRLLTMPLNTLMATSTRTDLKTSGAS